MFRRKVEHMLMARITQERPPLRASTQGLGNKGHLAPPSDQTAEFEAPVGMEIIHYPVVAPHIWQLLDDMGQMGGKIGTGTRRAHMPHDVPRWYHKRSDQCPYRFCQLVEPAS